MGSSPTFGTQCKTLSDQVPARFVPPRPTDVIVCRAARMIRCDESASLTRDLSWPRCFRRETSSLSPHGYWLSIPRLLHALLKDSLTPSRPPCTMARCGPSREESLQNDRRQLVAGPRSFARRYDTHVPVVAALTSRRQLPIGQRWSPGPRGRYGLAGGKHVEAKANHARRGSWSWYNASQGSRLRLSERRSTIIARV